MANFSNDTSTSLVSKSTYPSSLDSLFIMHKKRIFNYINSKIKDVDVSNDILQETFIKVFKVLKNGKYVEKGKFLSWVLRISHNLVMDDFRNKKLSELCRQDNVDELSSRFPLLLILKHLCKDVRRHALAAFMSKKKL